MNDVSSDPSGAQQLTRPYVELAHRLGALALILYWSLLLVRPFITIMVWSTILAVALCPTFNRTAAPGASLITFAVLICGIIQVGPAIVLLPVIIWAWTAMDTTAALVFTAYMVPVNLLDNVLKPVVMGRGLTTPLPIIFIGAIGGTLAHGIVGLFLGPIVLAVFWELLIAWLRDSDAAPAAVKQV